MKYCFYCGKNLPDDAVFCRECGKEQITNELKTAQLDSNHPQDTYVQKGDSTISSNSNHDGFSPMTLISTLFIGSSLLSIALTIWS